MLIAVNFCLIFREIIIIPGVILKTEGSVRKIQETALFHYKKVKKGTLNWTSQYVYSFFTNILIKQVFEKKVIEGGVRKSDSVLALNNPCILTKFL